MDWAYSPPVDVTATTGKTVEVIGHRIEEATLRSRGFTPLALKVISLHVEVVGGMGCAWDTEGRVPQGPGIYAFTVDAQDHVAQGLTQVVYVGMTEELWMVTKGRLPSGDSRPAQRYGRPKYAGVTRQRVNLLIASQLRQGLRVQHWVMPLDSPVASRGDSRIRLLDLEQGLIAEWHLRSVGWNRG